MRKGEYILIAATWFDDGKEHAHQPKNIATGLVYCAYRHCSIYPLIGGSVVDRKERGFFEKKSGFLTSKNRFVDREEALQIALAAGQVDSVESLISSILTSEDLWTQVED